MSISSRLSDLKAGLPANCKLVAVSKTHPTELIQQAYDAGQKIFGENKVQELVPKFEALPKDIQWHMIGHLQSNKVKYIAAFVYLIHSVDSVKLLEEINKQAGRCGRIIEVLLQIHIANEDSKFGFSESEVIEAIQAGVFNQMKNIRVVGLMGMATLTVDQNQIRNEFRALKQFFERLKSQQTQNFEMRELSMGMSSDYHIAIEEGSTLIRVGSAIFGNRDYNKQSA